MVQKSSKVIQIGKGLVSIMEKNSFHSLKHSKNLFSYLKKKEITKLRSCGSWKVAYS